MANRAFDRLLSNIEKGESGATAQARAMIERMSGDERAVAQNNLRRAISAAGAKKAGSATDAGGIGKGVDLVQQRAWDGLSKNMRATIKRYQDFSVQIQKAAGTSAKGSGQIIKDLQNMQAQHTRMGVTMNNAIAASVAAMREYAGAVTPAFKKDRMEVTRTIAVYDKLGITTGTSIKMMNTFGAVLGKTRTEVGKIGQQMNHFAKFTGQSWLLYGYLR